MSEIDRRVFQRLLVVAIMTSTYAPGIAAQQRGFNLASARADAATLRYSAELAVTFDCGKTRITLEPRSRIETLSRDQLRRGVVIGRIRSAGDFSEVGVRRGDNFVWVRMLNDTSAEHMIFQATGRATRRAASIEFHEPGREQAPLRPPALDCGPPESPHIQVGWWPCGANCCTCDPPTPDCGDWRGRWVPPRSTKPRITTEPIRR